MAYRAHFAFAGQNLTDDKGHATETTFGFFRMLAKLIADRKPTHLVICFDPGRDENPRYEMYKDYKANRPPMPDELRRQIEDIQHIAGELNLPPLIVDGAEADDTIASIVEQHKEDFDKIEIVSGDKDLYNILYKNVVMLRSKIGVSEMEEINEAWVKNKLGITREQVPDYMALVGDTADNIPGVKGVGEKTASKLIAEYKSLDKIYKNLAKIKPDGLKVKLETSHDMAYVSQKLVTLRKDIKLKVKPAAMELKLNPESANIFRARKLPAVASEWEKVLKAQGVVAATFDSASGVNKGSERLKPGAGEASRAEIAKFCQQTQVVKTAAELSALLKELAGVDEICVDTKRPALPFTIRSFSASRSAGCTEKSIKARTFLCPAMIPARASTAIMRMSKRRKNYCPRSKNFSNTDHRRKSGRTSNLICRFFARPASKLRDIPTIPC